MKKKNHFWLLRIYALLILAVLFGKFLEGAAFTLVIAFSAIAIIVSSFFLEKE